MSKPNSQELLNFFSTFFSERGFSLEGKNIGDLRFVADVMLDSFEILSMVIQLETDLGIQIPPEELANEQNASVDGLITTLLS